MRYRIHVPPCNDLYRHEFLPQRVSNNFTVLSPLEWHPVILCPENARLLATKWKELETLLLGMLGLFPLPERL